MADNSFKIKKSLNLQPQTAPTVDEQGDIAYDSSTDELVYSDGSNTNVIATTNTAQTLTDKTIDAASNTISNISADMTTLASEAALDLAVQDSGATINIGTGSGTNTINIGGADTSINLIGSVFSQDVTDLIVTDKLITVNSGGAAGSALGSGIEVEEDSVITASVKISTDRNSWELKAPNTAGVASLTPGSTNDVVTLNAAAQVLTNKDIDGGTASNARRITLPKDAKTNLDALTRKQGTLVYDTTSNKPYYDDGTVLKVIGSGSGGAVNFIEGGDAEAGTTGWATYADAAGTRPVDGTGGSPTVTWTTSSSSPLTGTNSFLLTKDAANRQGEGVAYAFTIDASDKAKVLQVSFDYLAASGTFVAGSRTTDSDVIVYLYDVTNARLLEPSTIKLFSNSTTIADKFSAYFQTAADSTSYRLILHVASTSASAYELKIDNVSVSPSQYVYGTPITDWQAYTPTFTGLGTVSSASAIWRRVGANLEVIGRVTTGTVASSNVSITIPSGLSLATTTPLASTGYAIVGQWARNATSALVYSVIAPASGNLVFAGLYGGGTRGAITPAFGIDFGSTESQTFKFQVPIEGWSSSVQMSDSADTRVVSFFGQTSGSLAITANSTLITFGTIKDSHAAWDGDEYVVPVAGDYQISANVNPSAGVTLYAQVNGATPSGFAAQANLVTALTGSVGNGSLTIPNLRSGDRISFKGDASVTLQVSRALAISRISGPSAIAATETIVARLSTSTARSISNTTPTIVYENRDDDSHNAYNTSTGEYRVPAAGRYSFSGYFRTVSLSGTVGHAVVQIIYVNGVEASGLSGTRRQTTNPSIVESGGGAALKLNAGDIVTIRIFSDASTTLQGSNPTANFFTIHRIGL